jgi:hypothetical protein
MTQTWKLLGFIALFMALVAAPALRASDPEKKTLTDSEKLDVILRQIGDLRAELKADIKDARIQSELRSQVLEERLKSLADRVDRLEKDAVTKRSSYFEPVPAPAMGPRGVGTIYLRNSYSDLATVYLNGTPYTLLPNQVVTLPSQPSGAYTYEVAVNHFGTIRGPITRVLNDNGALEIYVYAGPFAR